MVLGHTTFLVQLSQYSYRYLLVIDIAKDLFKLTLEVIEVLKDLGYLAILNPF